MAEKLFNYLVNAYKDEKLTKNTTLPYYDNKLFEGKINVLSEDIDEIINLMYLRINKDAYDLFKKYINNESVMYDEKTIELLKENAKLLPYALNDTIIPSEVKKEFENFIKSKRLKNRIGEANYDIKIPKPDSKKEVNDFFTPLKLKTDEGTQLLIQDFKNKIASKTITFEEISQAFMLSPQVKDREFKKALFEFVDNNLKFSFYSAQPIKYAIAHERDIKMLEHIFEKHEAMLLCGGSHNGDYSQTIIYEMQNHPRFNERIAEITAQGMNAFAYVNDKATAAMGCIAARFGKLSSKDYEYFCEGLRYTNHRYDVNRRTITDTILKSSKTPLKYLRKLSVSLDNHDRVNANIALKIKDLTSPQEYEDIMKNIMDGEYTKTESLSNEIKKAIYTAIVQTYQDIKGPSLPYNPIEEYKSLLAILKQNNELMPEFNQYHLSYLEEKTRGLDDFERLYLIEKELEKSKEYRYVMIERGLWKGIEEKDLADDILSEESKTPISFTSSIEEKENER